jgi:hypothetical protein
MSRMTLDACPAAGQMPRRSEAAAMADAEARLAAGEEQRLCSLCSRWRWPDEVALCPVAETISRAEYARRNPLW